MGNYYSETCYSEKTAQRDPTDEAQGNFAPLLVSVAYFSLVQTNVVVTTRNAKLSKANSYYR